MSEFLLSVSFGLDQLRFIEPLIEELQADKKIKGFTKEPTVKDGEHRMAFHILFDSIHSVYYFGHRQALMATDFYPNFKTYTTHTHDNNSK